MNEFDNHIQLDPLTERETEILNLLVEGLSNPEIADHLVIGLETVRWHIKQLYSKLGVHSRTQAIRQAHDLGLLDTAKPSEHRSVPAVPKSNLPTYSTSFVGRENEIAELTRLVEDPNVRLISIIGPGGIGKTRLCVEIARQQQDHFEDGVYFIPMLAVQSVNEIELAIANGVGLRLDNDKEPRPELIAYLQRKHLLLLLDSLEHRFDEVDLIVTMLKSTANLKIMATSHASLNLREEWVRYLEPLDVPPSDDIDAVETYGAVALFEDCVRRVRGDFSVADHVPAVVQICRTVYGIPLALELAAAWLKTLLVEDVAREIQQNIDFLATTQRDVEARHRSIQAVFEHSWNLLTDEEQRTFQRLSVFRGRFGRPAAEQVAGASILILSELVGKSLLQQHSTGSYEIHGLLREYAERKLESRDVNLLNTRSSKLQMWAAFIKGKHSRVEQAAEMALKIANDQGKSAEKAFALGLLGVLAGIDTDYERCRQLCEAGQALSQDDIITAIVSHLGLSIACCGVDDYGSAKHYIRAALTQAIALRIPAFCLLCLPVIALVAASEEKLETAVELMALAFTHPDSTLDWIKKWPLISQIEADLQAELGSAEYQAAWERGKLLNAEQVADDLAARF